MEKSSGRVIPLSELPVGSAGVVVGLQEAMRGVKKFADAFENKAFADILKMDLQERQRSQE